MDYAAELGLGKRKRPVEDDTSSVNPHSGKTVRITNLTAARDATSVPAITTEAVAGSSYPTPEFTPETIGGVEMRVAESPAKGRRQVRFNTPGEGYGGGGVIGSSEGSSAMKRKVKATTEGGWFGPKLGGKGLGVGVKVRAPVEVRRQPAGVEVGRGGWRGRSL
jgi:hypothetical protein